jgi:hypothetical protein
LFTSSVNPFFEDPLLSSAHPPGIISETFKSPGFSQLIKAEIRIRDNNDFFIFKNFFKGVTGLRNCVSERWNKNHAIETPFTANSPAIMYWRLEQCRGTI